MANRNNGNSDSNKVLENMRKNDKFIGDILAPFEQALGMKFNKFEKPEDPKYVEPKKVNLKLNLKKAERKQQKLAKVEPEQAKKVHWKNAIDKANGIKNKDDPKMIKRVIKRKKDEKKRHQKKWAERTKGTKSKERTRGPKNKVHAKGSKNKRK